MSIAMRMVSRIDYCPVSRTFDPLADTLAEPYGPAGRSPWLDVDWRKHQRWVTINDRPINVIDWQGGEGQPIVFVHGLSGSWQNWLEQLPVFAALGYRAVALDQPGFGYSPMPAEKITISGYARALDGVMDALGIDAATVVGNSMGGFVATEFAIAFPQRVERLVLAAPAGISTYGSRAGLRWARIARALRPLLAAQMGLLAAHADTVTRWPRLREVTMHDIARHPSQLPPELVAEQLRGAGKPGFVEALEACLHYDFRDRLPEIACPTLIVWGARDRVIPVRDADVLMELIPNARKMILEDTGHVPMLERPERFNQLLELFINE
jgi:pimeloyl-ACP methyl ester carboxylesterase